MCGINYLFSASTTSIKEMNQTLAFRGLKNHTHNLVTADKSFGSVRLPIQDLSHDFDQPYIRGNYIFLYSGEIYKPGIKNDLELFANFVQSYGVSRTLSIINDLDFMLSAIVYNLATKETHIITDFLAKKPLYVLYHRDSKTILGVSSEIKSLTIIKTKYRENHYYYSTVAKFGYCRTSDTFDMDIIKLPPAVHITLDTKGNAINVDNYVQLSPQKNSLYSVLKDAVKNRLIGDRPVSLLISGGLDSTIVYYLARQFTDEIALFHIDNNEEEYLNYLDIPSNITVKKLHLDKIDRKLNTILYYNESPVDLGSMIPQYLLGEAIRKMGSYNIVLSGDGADELFGGYKRINDYDSQYSDIYDELIYYHLPRLDKLMMANTIEIRCPYLSRKVIETAMSLPYSARINKQYLKETFKELVPSEIINRKKQALKTEENIKTPQAWRLSLIERFKNMILP